MKRAYVAVIADKSTDQGSYFVCSLPDFPGVFAGGINASSCLKRIEKAVATYIDFNNISKDDLPKPTPIDDIPHEHGNVYTSIVVEVDE